ncbi:hypothetical protein FACS1894178_7830 [Bacteroidia bacterium]|nr:hypothetical protein FACS1894178_7830 [Bacteroidia bacterium]
MRHSFLIFGFFIVCSTLIYGQDNKLIYSKQVSNRVEKSNEILRKSETYTSVDFVEINLDKILDYEQFSLQLGGKNISIKKERIDVRNVNNYVFIGSNNEGSRVLISVLDDDIQGVIEMEGEVFTIETVGKQEYAIIKVDYSKLREACENLHEENKHSSFDDENSHNHDTDIENDDEATISPILKSATAYDCKIRVLVLYTPNAQSSVSNIKNTALTAIALTNQSFVNSHINYQVELVYLGRTNYTESGSYSTDLSRFRISGDGYMDEVHTLRNKYSADICVLLNYTTGVCGVATGIGVTSANAFCLVSTYSTCATSNYSFGHEIGHLLGCRHDPYVDNSTTPFAYGHGYVHTSNTWRTIMAYANACGSCPRLQYWSNPNVTYGGEPMGTAATHNNTRVWNEQSNTVMAFRQPDNNITLVSGDIPNTQYADIIAKQDITTSGTVNVNSGNTLNMRAGNSITLQPGFSVELEAEFSATIENIYDCGGASSSPAPKIIVQNVPEEYDDMTDIQVENVPDFSYTVYPNPSYEFINITYSLNTEMSLSIELINLFGQKTKTILPKQNQQAGNYTLQISVSDFSTGTYFLTISSVNQTKTEKIIINK